jgi:DNA-binding transcriptional MerR regulator
MSSLANDKPEQPRRGRAGQDRRQKSADAFRTISEVATELDVQQHVLRFWETRFNQIKPMKRGGGRRYYRPADVALLRGIRKLLHEDGYTIKGVQKVLREKGVKAVAETAEKPTIVVSDGQPVQPQAEAADAAAQAPGGIDAATRKKLEDLLSDLQDLREQITKK